MILTMRWRSSIWIIVSCVGLGAIPGLIQSIFQSITLRQFGLSALAGSIYSTCIAIPCWAVMPRVLCYLDNRSLRVRLAACLPLLAIFSVLGCLVANLILIA